ncbi:MAG: DUF4442 domain-containing protein [Sideroxydans sp.]|nr:DUF4442 domain-containing protein [Sideroxydans sp.]MDD5470998.1 DUF4442 domain-containing protein [Sideroxydans sp.]
MNWIAKLLSDEIRETWKLRVFGLARIPLLFYVGISIVELTPARMVIRIPLRRRTKNHLGSMYFGALCIGADVAPGAYAMYLIQRQPVRINMVFKDFQAEFLKRAEGDVHFICNQGKEIAALVAQAAASEERVEKQLDVLATVPSVSDEAVARFKLTISLKQRL